MSLDEQLRLAAFEWLKEQESIHGDVLPRVLLTKGFLFEDERILLMSPQGIFKPRRMKLPLSITTAPHGPYNDSFSPDGFLLYRYQGTDPSHHDNAGLRATRAHNIPLVYFHGLARGRYLAAWPVYIIGDDTASLTFKVAVDDSAFVISDSAHGSVGATTGGVGSDKTVASSEEVERRAYITTVVKQRLHQRSSREKVLRAYSEQCSLCRLSHYELPDAAHIIPDNELEGVPEVRNGIALCKLHHAAFDAFLPGIRLITESR